MPNREFRPSYHCWVYTQKPRLTALITSPVPETTLTHAVLFVGGLTDSPGSVRYTEGLSLFLQEDTVNIPFVQPQLPSSGGGYGCSSLDEDVEYIRRCMDAVERDFNDSKPISWILAGHSTGCQDVMHMLLASDDKAAEYHSRICGGILQAAVSDREDWENGPGSTAEGQALLAQAKKLCDAGEGHVLLPRDIPIPLKTDADGTVNGASIVQPAMTAYRFCSLNAMDGDDDYFSSDIAEQSKEKFARAAKVCPVFIINSAEDQYVPKSVDTAQLLASWKQAAPRAISTSLIPKANHTGEGNENALLEAMADFILTQTRDART